jgi:hypothetical protein
VPSADLGPVIRQRMVVKVGLILKTKGVRLQIKRFGPGRRAPDSKDTSEQK